MSYGGKYYRIKFRSHYIVVTSDELAREIENLIKFVEHNSPIDLRNAAKTLRYLKKYRMYDAVVVELVKLAETKIVELLKKGVLSLH